MVDLRQSLLGGRFVSALTGSAPISPELKSWVESFLDMHLLEGYGSTEAGAVFVDGVIRRPPVIDYKLVDVPELGYFSTDVPHPRGELLVKSEQLFPGYYKRPEVTAEVFDADGYYRTGDVVAELGPDQVKYLDRRNNVLKLSQGEFVTVSKLEAAFGDSPLVRQIYIYGNSARPYLLAVVVPTEDALSRYGADELKSAISASLKDAARSAALQSYEIPRDFLVETTPFTMENGLLTGIRKLAWPRLKERYGAELEQLYVDLSDGQAGELRALRQSGADRPVLETVSRAASALLGAAASDVQADAQFTDLGGDSLSALTFANLLHEIFDVDVPVGVIVSPASDLAAIAAYVEAQRAGGSKRPTYDAVHGRDATEVHASDLTLDKFLDAEILAAASSLPGPSRRGAHRIAHRRNGIPRPLSGAGVAGADGPGRRQGDLPGPRQGRCCRTRPAGRDVRQSNSRSLRSCRRWTRSCWRTTVPWPPSTSRCSQATRARRTSAWTTRRGSGWPTPST